MKKAMKKLTALAMVAAMAVGALSGCSKDDSKSGGISDKPAKVEASWGMESWEKFEEQVHITVPVYDRSKEGYPAVDNNYWTQWVQKEFGDKWNVKVEYVAIPRNDVMNAYNLLISSDETPTIMMEYDYPKVAQWASEGAMQTIDLTKFAEVAPTYYQKMIDNNQLSYTDIGDGTYFVLSERPYYNTTYTFVNFVRMDWLRQVGYDHVPQTYEEYTDALTKIVKAGLTTQPVGIALPTSAYVQNFPFRDYPIDEKEWAMHSSLGTASLTWEPTKEYLRRQNAEYNKGWISSEYNLDTNETQKKADFVNGKTFMYGNYMAANVDWLTSFYENNPGAELAVASNYYQVEAGVVDFPQMRSDNPFGMIVGFSALATEDELKAAWMLMEWMIQEENLFVLENGIEGVTYTLDDQGLPVVDGNYRGEEMLNHNCNIDMTCLVHASKVTGTIEQSIAAISPQGLPQDFTQALIDNYYELKSIAEAGHAYSDPVFSVEIKMESEYTATLLDLYKEYSVQLTKCKPEEFDALYEKLSKQYLEAGYQKIIDERLAAYNAGKTTKLPK